VGMSFASAVEQSTAMETVTVMKMTHFMAMTMMMILKYKIIESVGIVMIVFDNLCGNIYVAIFMKANQGFCLIL
jgi:hypothetical protein